MHTGSRLRDLFAVILVHCSPTDPLALWEEFRDHICDDLPYWLRQAFHLPYPSHDNIYDYGLFLLSHLLRQSGHQLSDFGLPVVVQDWSSRGDFANPRVLEEMSYDVEQERTLGWTQRGTLNRDQLYAFEQITQSTYNHTGRLFFVNGSGGTGKTYLYATICHTIRGGSHIVLCVASSGIAALLLPHGRTAHSMFKIPVEGLTEDSSCAISKDSQLAGLIRATRLII
ncbi:PIF1-like helicase-domain-containing protein, partial [Earliella scabrosa]